LTHGYSGPSITKPEYDAALLVRELVRGSFLAGISDHVGGWLGHHHVSFQTLEAPIDVSPKDVGNIDFDSNLVVLGTGVYNLVAKHYIAHDRCQFSFKKNRRGERIVTIRRGGLSDIVIPGRSRGREIAVLQRINDDTRHTAVFLCAGTGSSATYGCVRFLVTRWPQLQKRHRDGEFAVFLAFPGQSPDTQAVVEPVIVYETGTDDAAAIIHTVQR
jgi:hypothetical protein